MAICSSSTARGRLVVTESGRDIGHVLGFQFDTERGVILQIEVRPGGFVRGLVAHELLIAWNQVVRWEEERVVVKDAAVDETAAEVLPSSVPCKSV